MSALRTCADNQTPAAGLFGTSRRALASWLDAYEIERMRKPR